MIACIILSIVLAMQVIIGIFMILKYIDIKTAFYNCGTVKGKIIIFHDDIQVRVGQVIKWIDDNTVEVYVASRGEYLKLTWNYELNKYTYE